MNNLVQTHPMKEKPIMATVKRVKPAETPNEKRQKQDHSEERLKAIASIMVPSLNRIVGMDCGFHVGISQFDYQYYEHSFI